MRREYVEYQLLWSYQITDLCMKLLPVCPLPHWSVTPCLISCYYYSFQSIFIFGSNMICYPFDYSTWVNSSCISFIFLLEEISLRVLSLEENSPYNPLSFLLGVKFPLQSFSLLAAALLNQSFWLPENWWTITVLSAFLLDRIFTTFLIKETLIRIENLTIC